MPVILIQSPCISQTGVAARPGAGRPYERNKYPQTTPLNRRENFFFTFFKKRLGKVLEYEATGGYAVRSPLTIRLYCLLFSSSSFSRFLVWAMMLLIFCLVTICVSVLNPALP